VIVIDTNWKLGLLCAATFLLGTIFSAATGLH
jgi:hypothetical protein